MKKLFSNLYGDRIIWIVVIILMLFSLVAVYGSISTLAVKSGGSTRFLFKHGLMLGLGFLIMYKLHRVNFKYYSRIAYLLYWPTVVLLILTLFMGINLNNASRWLNIPFINMSFQTSDVAKIVLVAYIARMLKLKQDELGDFSKGLIPVLMPAVLIIILILPANFSSAALLTFTVFVMLFAAGIKFKYLFRIIGMGLAGVGLLFALSTVKPELFPRIETWKSRIVNFSKGDTGESFQVEHAMAAIYNGGLFPQMPGTGKARNYLPHPYSDMIYAYIVEEYGSVLGGLGIMLLYVIFLTRSMRLAIKSQDMFARLTVVGLSFMIVTQAFINMAVAVNLIPVTGQPMPLVSMGGTSTLLTSVAVGMILGISTAQYNPEALLKHQKKSNTADGNAYAAT
jgi:cell division protein FtsW